MTRTTATTLAFVLLFSRFAHADPPSPDLRRSARFLDRAVVAEAMRLAIVHAGLQPERTRDLASRARAAALLPSLSVRVMRGLNASTAQTAAVPYGDRFASDDSLVVDVRAQFDLDRLVFDAREVALERVEVTRTERRDALEREVVELLAALTRADVILSTSPVGAPEWIEAQIVTARTRARLEGLLGIDVGQILQRR